MNTEAVNTVVARCLLEPGYLERFEADPRAEVAQFDLEEPLQRDLRELDCRRVRRFAGFISKVQHNDLWDSFPYTRALLKYYGAELDTFAAYRQQHLALGLAGRPSKETKTTSFLSFLERRLVASSGTSCPGLLDVLRHERLLWEVARELSGLTQRNAARVGPMPELVTSNPDLIVAPNDVLRVAAVTYHPLEVIAALLAATDQLTGIAPNSTCLCYWGRWEGETIRVIELDALTATILAAVDGRRTVRGVVRQAGNALHGEIEVTDVHVVLDAAVERGLIRLAEPPQW